MTKAFAYFRTSSGAGLGDDKDSEARQRAAVNLYAEANGIEVLTEFYDKAVRGSDLIENRPAFADMMATIAGNGVRMILVETANRFARDLITQETGWRMLKRQGIELVAVDSPQAFVDDTPTANLIRQILGAVAQFEKAALVAKLTAARKRTGRMGGQVPLSKTRPETVFLARSFAQNDPPPTLRAIADALATLGHVTPSGKPYNPAQIARILKETTP